MAKWSKRQRFWLVLAAVPIWGLIVLWVGPAYIDPLPMWLKLVIVAAGVCFIGTVAIYSRRRARRASRPDNLA